jgi:hypothetical protein
MMSRYRISAAVITLSGLLASWVLGVELKSIDTAPSVVRFEFRALGEGARALLGQWQKTAQVEAARQVIEVDFLFIVAYVTLGLGLVLLVRNRIRRPWRWWLLLGIPPAAGILDWFENRGMLDLLDGQFADHVPVAVTAFAAVKFLLLAVGGIALLRVTIPLLRALIAKHTWLVPLIAATAWFGAAGSTYRGLHRTAILLAIVGVALIAAIIVKSVSTYYASAGKAGALGFAAVRAKEREQIDTVRPRSAAGTPLVGLALSGGGIRSATFNLGLLQALARMGLLSKFDYLSTVSGGGYIG